MSTKNKNNHDDQEIDLSFLSDKVNGLSEWISGIVFKSIQFILRNIVIVGILFALGVGIGLYLDRTSKVYDNQIVVQPNFGSTDYLYSKIDLIQSKIQDNDTVFLKSIGLENPSDLLKIEVKPVIDIYQFVTNNTQNFELLKLMAEDGDMKKIVEEKLTSKNYSFHLISFKTKTKVSHKVMIDPILNYLNNSGFFRKVQKVYIDNIYVKMKENDIIIGQIDAFLSGFSTEMRGTAKNDKLIYYNENTQMNDIIVSKNNLISEQGRLRLNLVDLDKIIKEINSTLNIRNTESVNGKLKLILPLLFLFLFIFTKAFFSFYKRQAAKNK